MCIRVYKFQRGCFHWSCIKNGCSLNDLVFYGLDVKPLTHHLHHRHTVIYLQYFSPFTQRLHSVRSSSVLAGGCGATFQMFHRIQWNSIASQLGHLGDWVCFYMQPWNELANCPTARVEPQPRLLTATEITVKVMIVVPKVPLIHSHKHQRLLNSPGNAKYNFYSPWMRKWI